MKVVQRPGDSDGPDYRLDLESRDGHLWMGLVPESADARLPHAAPMGFRLTANYGDAVSQVYFFNAGLEKFVCPGLFDTAGAASLREENAALRQRIAELEGHNGKLPRNVPVVKPVEPMAVLPPGNGDLTTSVVRLVRLGHTEREIATRLEVGKGTVGRHKMKAREMGLLA